jgi:hypothetical protein
MITDPANNFVTIGAHVEKLMILQNMSSVCVCWCTNSIWLKHHCIFWFHLSCSQFLELMALPLNQSLLVNNKITTPFQSFEHFSDHWASFEHSYKLLLDLWTQALLKNHMIFWDCHVRRWGDFAMWVPSPCTWSLWWILNTSSSIVSNFQTVSL